MKILAIGNSFSEDATYYLHKIARHGNEDWKVVNLYISSASLYTHYINALEDQKSYLLQFNGKTTGFCVSLKEALISDRWDVVTLQQVSTEADNYETYQPYLGTVAECVRKYCPRAKLYLHQTWAYEENSKELAKTGYNSESEMIAATRATYKKAAKAISADGIIPSGDLFDSLLSADLRLYRDHRHASYGIGRYALGLLWYRVVTGRSPEHNHFPELEGEGTAEEMHIIRKAVDAIKI